MQPRWQRIADEIRDQIRSGQLTTGDMLPSYRLLGEQHSTSYGTIRMAMAVLRTEGWIEGEPGVGVRVREDHPA